MSWSTSSDAFVGRFARLIIVSSSRLYPVTRSIGRFTAVNQIQQVQTALRPQRIVEKVHVMLVVADPLGRGLIRRDPIYIRSNGRIVFVVLSRQNAQLLILQDRRAS